MFPFSYILIAKVNLVRGCIMNAVYISKEAITNPHFNSKVI